METKAYVTRAGWAVQRSSEIEGGAIFNGRYGSITAFEDRRPGRTPFYKNHTRAYDVFERPPFRMGQPAVTAGGVVFMPSDYEGKPHYSAVFVPTDVEFFGSGLIPVDERGIGVCILGKEHQLYGISYVHLKHYARQMDRSDSTSLWLWVPQWEKLFAKRGDYFVDFDGETFPKLVHQYGVVSLRLEYERKLGKALAIPKGFPSKSGTGLHINREMGDLVSYYTSPKAAQLGQTTHIKPGRYLKKFFPELTDDEIREASAIIKALNGSTHLKFYSSSEDMIDVYLALKKAEIVSSCVALPRDRFESYGHPLNVYHESDVELAVLTNDEGDPLARALYNKNTREYPMIYGQWERMKIALDNAGFTHGSLNGARINRIAKGKTGYILMPYIDDHRSLSRDNAKSSSVEVYPDHCIINSEADHGCGDAQDFEVYIGRHVEEPQPEIVPVDAVYLPFVVGQPGMHRGDLCEFVRADERDGTYLYRKRLNGMHYWIEANGDSLCGSFSMTGLPITRFPFIPGEPAYLVEAGVQHLFTPTGGTGRTEATNYFSDSLGWSLWVSPDGRVIGTDYTMYADHSVESTQRVSIQEWAEEHVVEAA